MIEKRPRKIQKSLFSGCLALIMLVLFSGRESLGAVPMPAFSLPAAINGALVNSDVYKGKAILVTFFATWCPPCLQEIPTLKLVHEKYGQQGFAVLALSVDEGGAGVVAQLVQRQKITYPVLMADRVTAKKFGGIPGVPTSFLVNKDGHVIKKYPGYVPRALLEKDILSVL